MNKLKFLLKSAVYTLLSLFILLASLLSFLLATTPGIYTSIKLANLYLPGKIIIKKPKGRLLDKFSLGQLQYHQNDNRLVMKNVRVQWQLSGLIKGQLKVTAFTADSLHLEKNDQEPPLDQPLKNIQLQGLFSNEHFSIEALKANYQGVKILFSGDLSPQYPYALNSSLIFSSKKNNPVQINGKITANGDFSRYQWEGNFQEPSALKLFGSLIDGKQVDAVFKWKHLNWPITANPSFRAGRGRLAVNGDLDHLLLSLNTKIKAPIESSLRLELKKQNQAISANTVLQLNQGYLHGELDMNSLNTPEIKGYLSSNELNLSSYHENIGDVAFRLDVSGPAFDKLEWQGNADIDYLKNKLSATLDYNLHQLTAKAALGKNVVQLKADGLYQWQTYAKITQPELLSPELDGLKTTLVVRGGLENSQQGQLNLILNQGQYQLPEDSPLDILYFNGGHLEAVLNKDGLNASGDLAIDAQKSLQLQLKLPHFDIRHPSSEQQTVNGELKLNINALDFLTSLSKNIEKAAGQLSINLKATGRLKNPEMTGDIQLSNAALSLPQTGLNLQPINAHLTTKNNNWDLSGLIQSNQQPLNIKGHGTWYPAAAGEIQMTGDHVLLLNNSDYKITVSPDLTFIFRENNLTINGTVTIPEARISPQTFSETTHLSDDVVYVGDEPTSKPYQINSNINLILGQDVQLDIQGLKGNLNGGINITQEAQGTLNASGDLSISNGFYKAYGQELIIDQGQLIFTGGLLKNPGINLRAVRRFTNTNQQFSGSNQLFDFNNSNLQTINYSNNLTVGIEVSGRLNSPNIKLFSNPANLSQADILSMLLLGYPASQANQAGGQLLLSAVSAMNLDNGTGGTQLLSQLKEKLGVDLNMTSSSSYNQQTGTVSESKAFVIGKSISKRLYISYNIGLLQTDANVLTIKYLLNKFFSIQVSASDTGNGIDFLYTRHKP